VEGGVAGAVYVGKVCDEGAMPDEQALAECVSDTTGERLSMPNCSRMQRTLVKDWPTRQSKIVATQAARTLRFHANSIVIAILRDFS
jgi:hypothetical protein